MLGRVATRLRDAGDEYDVRVMLREEDRAQTAQLGELPILSSRGVVPLSAVARVGVRRGPGSIEREGQERVLSIIGGLGDRPLGQVVAELEQKLGALELPAGFSVEVAGESEEQDKTFAGLTIGIVLALLLVFAVMAVQFESLRHPLLVMSAVPFGFVGVVIVLVVTGTTFSLNAFLGSIILVGIATNNAIVLVEAANQLRRRARCHGRDHRGRPPPLAPSYDDGLDRVGHDPIALAIGEGAEIQAPLARVVLGGMLVSSLITLVLLPVLYVLTARSGSGSSRARSAAANAHAAFLPQSWIEPSPERGFHDTQARFTNFASSVFAVAVGAGFAFDAFAFAFAFFGFAISDVGVSDDISDFGASLPNSIVSFASSPRPVAAVTTPSPNFACTTRVPTSHVPSGTSSAAASFGGGAPPRARNSS